MRDLKAQREYYATQAQAHDTASGSDFMAIILHRAEQALNMPTEIGPVALEWLVGIEQYAKEAIARQQLA